MKTSIEPNLLALCSNSISRILSCLAAILTLGLVPGPSARADVLFWDADGATSGTTGGTGTWNTTGSTWRLSSGTGTLQTWVNSGTNSATLAGTAGTVTLGVPITLGALTFGTSGYAVNGDSTNRLIFSGATVSISNTGAWNNTISAPITTGSGSTLTFNGPALQNSALTLNGSNSIGGTVTIAGSGKIALSNANALAGATGVTVTGTSCLTISGVTISGLTVTLNGGRNAQTNGGSNLQGSNSSPSGWAGNVILAADSSIGARDGLFTVSGTISESVGGRALYINPNTGDPYGNNVVVLSASNTYTGQTFVSGSTGNTTSGLRISSNANLGDVATGATLNLNNTVLYTTASFALDNAGSNKRNVVLTGSNKFDVAAATNLTVGGIVSGSGSLTKSNTGTLSLTGANTFTGDTTVSSGTLSLGNDLALQNSALNTSGGGFVALTGTTPTFGGLKGSTNLATVISSGYSGVTSLTLNPGTGVTNTYSGSIADGAAGMTLTKNGNGTQILSGTNTYSGATTISTGILNYGNLAALGSGTTIFAGNSTLQAGLAGTLANNVVVNPSVTGTFDTQANAVTLSGIVSGSGALTKAGSGTLTLSASNNYSGGTTVIGTGPLRLANSNAAGTGTITLNTTNTGIAEILGLSGGITVTNGIVITQGTSGRNNIFNVSGDNVYNGNVTVNGSGQIIVFANNGGTFEVRGQINAATLTSNLSFRGTSTGAGSLYSVITAPSSTLDFNGVTNWTIYSTGNNWGTTTGILSTGNLILGASDALDTSAKLDHSGAGDLDLNGFNQTVGGLNQATAVAGAQITNNSVSNNSQLTVASGTSSFTYANVIADGATRNVSLVVNSTSGTQTLTGSNTYTGATTINSGVLSLVRYGSINGSSGIAVSGSAAKFLLNNSLVAVTPTVTLTSGTIDGTGTINAVNIADAATATIANGNGTALPLNIGNLTFNGDATVNINSVGAAGLSVTNTLTTTPANGTVTINVAGSLPSGTRNLIGYGSWSGSITDFTLGTTPVLGPRQTLGALGTTGASNGFITLGINGDTPIWTGSANGNWTTSAVGAPFNWRTQTTGTGTEFLTNDDVLFDDNGVTTNVDITGASVTQNAVTFNNNTNNYTIGSSGSFGIAGAGAITKSGSGSVTLSSSNSYSGGTFINSGTLAAANANALSTGPVVNNATLNLTGTAASLTYSGLSVGLSGTGTVNVNLPTGSGSTLLNGDYSAFTGTWNIGTTGTGGKVQMNGLDNAAATINVLANGTVYVTAGTHNASIVLNGGDTGESLGQLRIEGGATWAGPVTLAGAITGSGDGNIGSNSGGGTISGNIGEINGSQALVKVGASTIVLSGSNTYTGATTVSAGTLKLGGAGALGDGVNNTSGVSINGSAILDLGGISPTAIVPLTMNSNANAFDVGAIENNTASTTSTFSGTVTLQQQTRFGGVGAMLFTGGITGNGVNFIKDSTGLLELQNSGTVTLGAFQANRGTLQVDAGTTLNVTSIDVGTGTSVGAGLTLNGGSVTTSGTARFGQGSGSASGSLTLNSGTLTVPALTKGSLTFNAIFNGGTLKANAASANFLTASSAKVQAGGAFIDDGGFAITIGQPLIEDTGSTGGGLTKSGTGTLTLTGANTYTGATTINAGTLQLGNNGTTGSLSASSAISGSSGTTLAFNRTNTVTQGTDFASTIGGDISVVHNGSGTVVLNGSNSYTGLTTVSGSGVLSVQHAQALGSTAAGTTVNSAAALEVANGVTVSGEAVEINGTGPSSVGALRAGAGGGTWDGQVTINAVDSRLGATAGNILTVTGSVVGSGTTQTLTISGQSGTGVVVLNPTGSNTYTGNTNLVRGILRLGKTDALPTGTVLDVDAAGGVADAVTFDMAGFNQTVGALQDNATTNINGLVTNSVTGTTSVLTVNQAVTTDFASTIQNGAGTVALVKSGTGTLIFTGSTANSYTGATTINQGRLQLGNNGTTGALSPGSAISGSSGATLAFNRTNTVTQGTDFASTIGGDISVMHNGSGTVVLNGSNSYTGGTQLTGNGVLTITDSNALGSGTLTLRSTQGSFSTTVRLQNNVNVANPILIDVSTGRENITATGSNTIHTLSGPITIAGTNNRIVIIQNETSTGLLNVESPVDGTGGYTGNLSFRGGATTGTTNRITSTAVINTPNATIDFTPTTTGNNWTIDSTGNNWVTTAFLGNAVTGKVILGANDALATGARVLWSGTTSRVILDLNGRNQTVAGLEAGIQTTGLPRVTNDSGSADSILTLAGLTADYAYTGAITDGTAGRTVSLVMNSVGRTQTLSGSSSYSGGTTITSGTLVAGNANALGASTGSLAVNGGTLDLKGNNVTVGLLSGSSGGLITTSSTASSILTAGTTGTSSYGGVIVNTSGTLGLTKVGNGTLTLGGTNAYNGLTTVSAGTLAFDVSETLTGGLNIATSGTAVLTAHTGTVKVLDITGLTISGTTAFAGGGTKTAGFFANEIVDSTGYAGAGLASPVPEPGTIGLLAVGVVGGLLLRRRSRKSGK